MSSRLRASSVVGLAAVGVLVGHVLTYAVVGRAGVAYVPSPDHGYLTVAVRLAVLAGAITIGALLIRAISASNERAPGPAGLAPRLAGAQAAAFVTIEVAERLGSAAPLHDLTWIVPTGIVIQTVLAISLARVLDALLRGVAEARSDQPHGDPITRVAVPLASGSAGHEILVRPWAPSSGTRAPPAGS